MYPEHFGGLWSQNKRHQVSGRSWSALSAGCLSELGCECCWHRHWHCGCIVGVTVNGGTYCGYSSWCPAGSRPLLPCRMDLPLDDQARGTPLSRRQLQLSYPLLAGEDGNQSRFQWLVQGHGARGRGTGGWGFQLGARSARSREAPDSRPAQLLL